MDVIPELERRPALGTLCLSKNSYKIAKRNHYHIGNISLWCDTIRMLSKVGKDIRNAHYICPTDLQATHDKLVKKIDEQAERERRAEDMERAAKSEAKFFAGQSDQRSSARQ